MRLGAVGEAVGVPFLVPAQRIGKVSAPLGILRWVLLMGPGHPLVSWVAYSSAMALVTFPHWFQRPASKYMAVLCRQAATHSWMLTRW